MPLNLTELEASVNEDDSVTSSAETYITALLDEIAANSGNQAAVDAIVAKHRAVTARLAAAIANTSTPPVN